MTEQKSIKKEDLSSEAENELESAQKITSDGTEIVANDIEEQDLLETDAFSSDEAELSYSELEQKLSEVEAQAAEYLDGWQRSRAEFANARKRLERDRIEARNRASAEYVSKILPILDDFERALENAPEDIEANSWFEGLLLVNRKLTLLLEEMRVEKIEALGQPFDPNYHEALSLKDVDGVESGIVVEELQTGFRLGDRIIRPALVNVAA